MSSKNLLSLFLCFKKSDALYLFSTNWLLLLIIDKFTITEFAILIRNQSFLVPPLTLGEHIYGVSVIPGKVYFRSPLAGCHLYYCFNLLVCIIEIYMSHGNLLKIALHHRYFSKNFFDYSCRTAILENVS